MRFGYDLARRAACLPKPIGWRYPICYCKSQAIDLAGKCKMPNKMRVAVAALCAALCAVSAAEAASVSPRGGEVLVSKGEGFVPLTAAAELAPGSKVLVQPGGLASIVYAGNCTVRVGSGVWTVLQAAPCTGGATEIDFTGRMNQAGPGGLGPTDLIMGGLVVAGGIGVGISVSQAAAGNDTPASP